ncbi:MAG TPA: TolC family protein [Candidatus Saccharimonadales bacterium]|nr:TolC family protein [Candidatus Saccharimonadales bacterium]
MTLKTLPVFLAVALPLAFTGCTSTNPKAAFSDLNKTVSARTGQSVQWPRNDSSSGEIAKAIEPLFKTNLTAQTAVMIAFLNNRTLQAEFEEIGISQADLAQASRLQNIELAGSWRFPNRPPSITDAEYSAAGNFLDLLTLPARKRVAAKNLEQTKLEVADKVLQLAADVQMAFYTLQAQLELTNRLATIVEVNDAAADFAQRQSDAGNIPDLELHHHQASAAESHLDLMRAQAQARAQRERLNRMLGLSGEQIHWRIADELPPMPENEASLENLESLAINQRLDLAASRSQAEAIAAALRLKKHTRFIPGVAVGVDSEQTPDGQRVTGPTLDLELPLFDQGQPAVARLAAKYRQARDNYQALEVNARSEVRQAQDALLAARQAAEFSGQHLLPLEGKILHETLLQYDAMQKSSYDLLLAKQREQTVVQDYIASLRDYWIARVELERAVGGRLTIETNAPAPVFQSKSTSPNPQH